MELMTVKGWSMSPWLKEGDVVVVSREIKDVEVGDIVVMENKMSGQSAIHRVIEIDPEYPHPFSIVTKGDRIPYIDAFGPEWDLTGKALGKFRRNKFKTFKFKKFLTWVSKYNFYSIKNFKLLNNNPL